MIKLKNWTITKFHYQHSTSSTLKRSKSLNKSNSGRDRKVLKPYRDFFNDDFDPEFFDRDNVFFTAGSGNPPLPDDLPDKLMDILKKN